MPAQRENAIAIPAMETTFFSLLGQSVRAQAPVMVLTASCCAALGIVPLLHPGTHPVNFLVTAVSFVALSLPIMLLGLTLMRIYHIAYHVRANRPLRILFNDLAALIGDRRRMASGLPLILALFAFMYVLDLIKANIPILAPFSWDRTFDRWDRVLHFGTRPWEWLQPVLGHWPVTFLINVNYNMWFIVMWTVWVFFAFMQHPNAVRRRFFFTFILTWTIGGGLFAVLLSSAGPCYFSRLGLSPDPYAPLMAYLHQVNAVLPIWALNVQDTLWQGYLGQSAFEGISAMPSMHNGSALLFALAAFKVNRTAGWLLSAHAALIFVGSIHLGWHYAVDGYVAWSLTLAVWWLSAPFARWWQEQVPVRNYLEALERA